MKRVALILVLSTNLYLLSAVAVSAATDGETTDTTTTTTTTETVTPTKTRTTTETDAARQKRLEDQKAALEERKTEKQATREARKEELTEKHLERLSDVASMRFDKIVRRFNAAISRLEHIIERFNTRLEKLAEGGHDVSEAQAFVDTAADHVETAKSLIADAHTQFPAVLSTENPASSFATVKDIFKQAKEELINAHEALRNALKEVKSLRRTDAEPEATEAAETVDS
ncbi:hypothetical protein HY469_03325 [Candidatus Roizmanbacteria bacterium]|nr:hypothetical protein [Candidatus Roizmanbacteria bacterium]